MAGESVIRHPTLTPSKYLESMGYRVDRRPIYAPIDSHEKPSVVESLNSTDYGTTTWVRACLGGWCEESRKWACLGGTMSERTAAGAKTPH